MSEYQYYEFQAVDQPLDPEAMKALRERSTRARITASSFSNAYQWGDLKGDPLDFMARWFDLHLYTANWAARRFMMRLPRRLVDRAEIERFLPDTDTVTLHESGDNLILDINFIEMDLDGEDDGTGWLAGLAPLREDVASGDLRMFYLLWLTGIQWDVLNDDEVEPMPGIGPLTGPLRAFADFFRIDPDLVTAAAERPAAGTADAAATQAAHAFIAEMTARDKTTMLQRLFDGDRTVVPELRAAVRGYLAATNGEAELRTVGELRARAVAVQEARERETARREALARKRGAEVAEKARRARLVEIAKRGDGVWTEVETEIERRCASGYDKATDLLADLRDLAAERGTPLEFRRRLAAIRERHSTKAKLLFRLEALA